MKKLLTSLVTVASFASLANADFARIEIGAGAWSQEPSGVISATASGFTGKDTSTESSQAQAYVWAIVKHPLPIIPNLRLEYSGIESDGEITGSFKKFNVTTGATTSFKLTQHDIIPYYNILDNTFWLTLDLGLDLRVMDMTYTASGSSVENNEAIVLPLLYVRTRFQLPITELGLEADVKYASYDSNTIYDARVKVDYTFDIFPVIQPAIEVGYRVQHIETNEGEDAKINMDFAGIYVGLMLRF